MVDPQDKDGPATSARAEGYDAVTPHWQHAETERWAILYNFLMASTILLLAWATVFTGAHSWSRVAVTSILALAGVLVCVLWLRIGARVNQFIATYTKLGEKTEDEMALPEGGPFGAARELRRQNVQKLKWQKWRALKDRETRQAVLGNIRSADFMLIIPALFGVVFLLLLIVPWITLVV